MRPLCRLLLLIVLLDCALVCSLSRCTFPRKAIGNKWNLVLLSLLVVQEYLSHPHVMPFGWWFLAFFCWQRFLIKILVPVLVVGGPRLPWFFVFWFEVLFRLLFGVSFHIGVLVMVRYPLGVSSCEKGPKSQICGIMYSMGHGSWIWFWKSIAVIIVLKNFRVS